MPAAVLTGPKTMEKYSSAFTLSDMEVFLFPELMYALVLANIMSPRIWAWRADPWFRNIERAGFNRQMQRLKQYIMEHYSFNLDLETWGLTTKTRELARFDSFVPPDLFSRSNALFGYTGDKHYFDQDIRRHFGLDQYDDDIIPYWKTETVEAMDAFRHKAGYDQGAGECVSLSVLYAAAMYIVLGISLEDIYLLATPLHSQNFVLRGEGVITNNRRLVTRTMWYNGSELSTKARRALEKERVTIVAHLSGYTHIEYTEATIEPKAYARFTEALRLFLTTPITFEIFASFLRVHAEFRKYYQFEYQAEGHAYTIPAEKLYKYEHGSHYRVSEKNRNRLLAEVETEEFDLQPDPNRYTLDVIEGKLNGQPLLCKAEDTFTTLKSWFSKIPEIDALCEKLREFTCVHPSYPAADKTYQPGQHLKLAPGLSREEVIASLERQRAGNQTADLAFYAGRQLDAQGWAPFFKACLERNPVSLRYFAKVDIPEVVKTLQGYPGESIYDGKGLATPDEVVNYGRGDGLEKAICLANLLKDREPGRSLRLDVNGKEARLAWGAETFVFLTVKPYTHTHDLT